MSVLSTDYDTWYESTRDVQWEEQRAYDDAQEQEALDVECEYSQVHPQSPLFSSWVESQINA